MFKFLIKRGVVCGYHSRFKFEMIEVGLSILSTLCNNSLRKENAIFDTNVKK